MRLELEEYLWNNMGARLPRDVIQEMMDRRLINSPKQAYRTLEKWVKQRKYEYGVCIDLGWKIR